MMQKYWHGDDDNLPRARVIETALATMHPPLCARSPIVVARGAGVPNDGDRRRLAVSWGVCLSCIFFKKLLQAFAVEKLAFLKLYVEKAETV
jgi:hypothetical protein